MTMAERTVKEWCQLMPKVELHRHFEGSLRPELLFRMAQRHRIELPFKSVEEYQKRLDFKSFSDFVPMFICGVRCLRAPVDFYEATLDLGRQLHADGILYADVTITPQFYLSRPFPLIEVFKALKKGADIVKEKLDVDIRWVTDLVRNKIEASEVAFHKLMKIDLKHYGVHALGLGGPEEGFSAQPFQKMFVEAKRQGLKSNPHAGECDGAASVALCIEALKADRIGHGVRAWEDPIVIQDMIDQKIPIEVCLSSNFKLGVFDRESHPVKKLFDAGVRLSLNTDDPVLFKTNLSFEYVQAMIYFKFDLNMLKQCTMAAAENLHDESCRLIVKEKLMTKFNALGLGE
jgi:adenosine deaminase